MEQLSGIDTLFTLREKRRTPMHIGALLLYEGVGEGRRPLKLDQVRQVFANNLHKSPVFRRKLRRLPYDIDKPYWVDDASFDLNRHLDVCSAEGRKSPRELWQLVGELHSRGLDMKKPVWNATLIEDLDWIAGYPTGATGLYIKVHHAAIDGLSGAAILAAIHSLSPDACSAKSEPEEWRPRGGTPAWWLAYQASSTGWIRKLSNAGKTREIARSVQRLREHVNESDSEQTRQPWVSSPFNNRVGKRRSIAVLDVSFADLKVVKRSLPSTTVNHVVLCIVAGAMRHYLQKYGALPANTLSAAVPISVRNRKDPKSGNVLSGMITALHTEMADPRERLRAVRDAAIEARDTAAVLGDTTLMELASVLSPQTSQTMLSLFSLIGSLPIDRPMPFNTIVSNVPGAPVDLYLGGARMIDMHTFGLVTDGVGLFHTATSYKDRFSIAALASSSSVPDINFYQRCLERSWRELRDAPIHSPPGN